MTLLSLLGLSRWLPSSLKELVAELLGRCRRRTRRKAAVLSGRALSSILPPLVSPLSLPFENVVGRVSHFCQFCFTTVLAWLVVVLFCFRFCYCFTTVVDVVVVALLLAVRHFCSVAPLFAVLLVYWSRGCLRPNFALFPTL